MEKEEKEEPKEIIAEGEDIEEEGPEKEDAEEEDIDRELEEFEKELAEGDDEEIDSEQVLFAIVCAMLKDPEGFGAEDVTLSLETFGFGHVIEQAKSVLEEEGDLDGDDDDTEDDQDFDDLISELESQA